LQVFHPRMFVYKVRAYQSKDAAPRVGFSPYPQTLY